MPDKTPAEKIRDHFLAGTLTYVIYKKLSKTLQKTYQSLHGYRPAAPHEIVGVNRKKAARAKAKKAEKAARKAAR